MEKSRFMVREMISRKWKGDFLISPKNRDGDEDLHLLLEMVMHEHSLIFFFFFFPFSSFSSPFFLSYCSSLEERERESRWEWDGSAGLAIQFMLTCGSKWRERKTGHRIWVCWRSDWAHGPQDHWMVWGITDFGKIDLGKGVWSSGFHLHSRGWSQPLEN